ncbi:hypothetical protein Godav_023659 [Gossypium davidsonii]|nr:hypothetical protein [Gossypium davidsonii]
MISAQALEPVCRRKMKTYAVAWVHSERKLSTRIDNQGHTYPTWNDKFVFRVHEEFLHRDTSTVTIEIYAVHWFRNIHVGTVRAIVGNLIPLVSQRQNRLEVQLGMQFLALQFNEDMPLYLQMGSSAVRYRHLIGEEDPFQNSIVNPVSSTSKSNKYQLLVNGLLKPDLRRTKSDSSSILESDLRPPGKSTKRSSIVDGGSIVNGTEIGKNNNKLNSRGSSMVNYIPKKGKSSSMVNGSKAVEKNIKINSRGSSMVNYVFEKTSKKGKPNSAAPPGKSPTGMRFTGLGCGAPRKLGGSTIWTDSELGPSPSEVAAAVAKNLQHNRMEETESSLADGWSLDESIEGLRTKLERWGTALPPLYDRGDFPGYLSSEIPTTSTTKHTRNGGRYPRDDGVSFSCFGNICGCAISITCGPGSWGSRKKRL